MKKVDLESCGCSLPETEGIPKPKSPEKKQSDPAHFFLIKNESPSELIWFLPIDAKKYVFITPGGSKKVAIPSSGLTSLPEFSVAHLQKAIIKNSCLVPHHKINIQMKDCDAQPITIMPGNTLKFYRLLDFGEGGCRMILIDNKNKEIAIAADINFFE